MDSPITVECVPEYAPPMVRVTIAGQQSFDVSWGVYTYLQQNFGFPPLICGAYSTGTE